MLHIFQRYLASNFPLFLYLLYRIRKLNLEGNKLGVNAIREICDSLLYNRALQILNLSKNGIRNESCNDISLLFEGNPSILEFYLSNNFIGGKGAVTLLKGLKINKGIKVFDMSWNKMGNNEEVT